MENLYEFSMNRVLNVVGKKNVLLRTKEAIFRNRKRLRTKVSLNSNLIISNTSKAILRIYLFYTLLTI